MNSPLLPVVAPIRLESLERLKRVVEQSKVASPAGKITEVVGTMARAICPTVSLGEVCTIETNGTQILAEVVGFSASHSLLMPLSDPIGLRPGARVVPRGIPVSVRVGPELLGRVVNGLGLPMDDRGPLTECRELPFHNTPPPPLQRKRITEPLVLGVRALDGLLTCGKGQRMGIMAGSGVGKSTLLGMLARNTRAAVNVIALIGERGREVREFIERDLGEEGLRRSVVVVATSDESPLLRFKAALCAMTVAEYFRDEGLDVLFMMDSLTRLAMAQREVGLAAGELPSSRGYPASVFAMLPKFLERSGTSATGTITALITVLVEADDFNEPIADHARAILDGHLTLTRSLAAAAHFPAIDLQHSVSRVMKDVVSETHFAAAAEVRKLMAAYAEARDLINIGAYQKGSDAVIDRALACMDRINAFVRQDLHERDDFDSTVARLHRLAQE